MNLTNLNREQVATLIAALDVYQRLAMGQLWAIGDALKGAKDANGHPVKHVGFEIRDRWTNAMTRDLFGFNPGASHGIMSGNVPEQARIAYDLQCVLLGEESPLHAARKTPMAKLEE